MNRPTPAQSAERSGQERARTDPEDRGPRFSDSTVFRAALGIILVAFGSFLWGTVAATRKLADANDASFRAVEVLRVVDGLTKHATRIENGFHGYILTRDVRHQVAWRDAQIAAWAQVRALAADPGMTVDQRRHLEGIDGVLKDWIGAQEALLQTVRTETALVVAVDPVRLDEISRIGQMLDTHSESVERIEATRMRVVYVTAESQQRRALVFATLAAALIPFLLLGVAILHARSTERLQATITTLEGEGDQRREIEASLERLARRHRVILDAAADGIIEVDPAGTVTFLNPAALHMLGIRGKHAAGQSYKEVVFGGSATGVEAEQATSTRQAVELALRDDAVHADANGVFVPRAIGPLPVELQVAPMASGGAVLTFRDVSAQRELARQRNQLMGILSHELRTPLTSVRGSLGLIAAGTVGTLNEKGQELLRIALKNADRLMGTISDILDVERIESGRFDLERASVGARSLVREALASVAREAESAGVILEMDVEDVTIHADRDRIVQVIVHLLENAVKFSPSGATACVEVVKDGGSAHFRVRDEGFGIPAEHLRGIFDRFHQVDASDARSRGGAGLGLTLSRGIIREHGADLEVESVVGLGSTFAFAVPLAAPEREDPTRDRRDDPQPAADRQAVA